MMEPHQQRVLDERNELNGRLSKLRVFITTSPTFDALPNDDKMLLKRQSETMGTYYDILNMRIERFNLTGE